MKEDIEFVKNINDMTDINSQTYRRIKAMLPFLDMSNLQHRELYWLARDKKMIN